MLEIGQQIGLLILGCNHIIMPTLDSLAIVLITDPPDLGIHNIIPTTFDRLPPKIMWLDPSLLKHSSVQNVIEIHTGLINA